MKTTAASSVKTVAKDAVAKVNPVSKVKQALKAYGDATSAKKMAQLSRGDKISMSRRTFLKGARNEAAGLIAKNPKKIAKPIAGAIKNTLNPIETAGRLSGVKVGKMGGGIMKIGSAMGLYSHCRNKIMKFIRR